VARRRPVHRRLARRRKAGAERPRHDLDRQLRRHQGQRRQCYNCHQISKAEISFGTIGPSLYNYGKNRGVSGPADPASAAVVQYTWGKIYNGKAYNACSNMPRFGHMGLLDEKQMAPPDGLLLDPRRRSTSDRSARARPAGLFQPKT
jgi:sulfur oxidation c-type cytochrome SoxX